VEGASVNVRSRTIVASTVSLVVFAGSTCFARAQSEPQDEPKQSQVLQAAAKLDHETDKKSPDDTSITSNSAESKDPPKRMFGMIPDFESANNTLENRKPLTVREKYILSLHQAFDFSSHLGDAFQSGIQQVTNSQPHFGQGWGAYGERFAASEGDQFTGSILIYGFFPSVRHEDPRYFRRGRGSSRSRVWYAVSRTFVTRRDDGTNGFNTSQTVGQLMSCGISTTYYPAQDRSASSVFLNWAVNLGYNSGYNVLTEYYTDMLDAVFHRHKNAGEASANTDSPL
jgi:hypothetical protein